jgi:hypothetical protein
VSGTDLEVATFHEAAMMGNLAIPEQPGEQGQGVLRQQYRRRGDARSSLYADIDWSDEINHVRYGKRWIEWFLRDDARTIADIQSEVRVRLSRHATSTGDGPTEFSPF